MVRVYKDPVILEGLARVSALVGRRRHFEALKVIRSMIPLEVLSVRPAAALAEAS